MKKDLLKVSFNIIALTLISIAYSSCTEKKFGSTAGNSAEAGGDNSTVDKDNPQVNSPEEKNSYRDLSVSPPTTPTINPEVTSSVTPTVTATTSPIGATTPGAPTATAVSGASPTVVPSATSTPIISTGASPSPTVSVSLTPNIVGTPTTIITPNAGQQNTSSSQSK